MELSSQNKSTISSINIQWIESNSMYVVFYEDKKYMVYHTAYPIYWVIQNEENKTGPRWCRLCYETSHIRGVCIGYCTVCAKQYKYSRGLGFCAIGKEYVPEEMKCLELLYSAKNTYLSFVDLSIVGIPTLMHTPSIDSIEFVYPPKEKENNSPIVCKQPVLSVNTNAKLKNLNKNAKVFTPKKK